MKNSKQGFVILIIIAIAALLAVGGGAYIYTNNKVEAPANAPDIVSNATTTPTNSTGTNINDKSSFRSQEEQTAARERAMISTWITKKL